MNDHEGKEEKKYNYKEFGTRLGEIMVRRDMTNKELARLMHVSESTISGYRTGRRSPSVNDLPVLAELLGVSADYLLGLTDKF
jgi:transcriptional regulator with XRE-family HTH domain